MRTKAAALITLTLALTLPSSVHAQCVPTDTPAECWHRFNPPITPAQITAAPAQAAASAQQSVATANTGVTSAATTPSASSLQDFLSLLSASLQSSSLTANGTALTFDWNPRIADEQPVKLEVVFAEPALSSAATAAFGTNAAGLATAKDSLTNTDDITVSATYSPVNSYFGRSIEPHRALFDSLISTAFSAETDQLDDAMIEALQAAGVTTATFAKRIDVISADLTQQKELIEKIEASARAQQQTGTFADDLTRSFAKLLNNQPQLNLSLQYQERNELVGPSQTIAKATYEYGFRSLNTFFRKYRATCDPLILASKNNDPASLQQCITLLEAYAGNTGPDQGGDGGRIAFSLEYHDSQPVHADLTQYSVKYDIDSGRTLVGSLTSGWIVAPRENGRSGRIDLSVSYEDIRNAAVLTGVTPPPPDVQDRLVASVTYTQKITDTISFPLTLVYANHAAYLSNVDRKLNAHFGLQYKLPTQ
ncbi:MAG TPA: hypothetical protein VFV49_09295 [Thermoanaerobaculia bacterium]|nr:hypothetical protein [Thermoanaerobaculia bacterium]